MRKALTEEVNTKALKREIKKRPRMKMHGRSLLQSNKHAGKKLASK